MANYPAEFPTEQGIAMTVRTAAASDTMPGGIILDVRNANAGICTVTITTPPFVAGDLAVADRVVSVPASTGQRSIFIPNNATYVDPVTGLVTVGFSPNASVTYTITSKS